MNIRKSVVALIAGALASIAGGLVFQVWTPPESVAIVGEIVIFAAVIISILYVSDIFSKLGHQYHLWERERKTLIGILNDAGPVNDGNSSCTHINPLDWKNELEQAAQANSLKIKVRLITTRNNFVPYSAILNPYGGAYPEPDATKLETLDKILEYVNEGGLFVNVADVPGYWAYNSRINRIFETPQQTFVSGAAQPAFPFSLVPFTQKLGLKVYNIQRTHLRDWDGEFEERYSLGGKIQLSVERAVVIERNVTPIIQPKTLNGNTKVTPVLLAIYGSGQCLISLPYLDNNLPSRQGDLMKRKLAKILLGTVGSTLEREIGNKEVK